MPLCTRPSTATETPNADRTDSATETGRNRQAKSSPEGRSDAATDRTRPTERGRLRRSQPDRVTDTAAWCPHTFGHALTWIRGPRIWRGGARSMDRDKRTRSTARSLYNSQGYTWGEAITKSLSENAIIWMVTESGAVVLPPDLAAGDQDPAQGPPPPRAGAARADVHVAGDGVGRPARPALTTNITNIPWPVASSAKHSSAAESVRGMSQSATAPRNMQLDLRARASNQ